MGEGGFESGTHTFCHVALDSAVVLPVDAWSSIQEVLRMAALLLQWKLALLVELQTSEAGDDLCCQDGRHRGHMTPIRVSGCGPRVCLSA